MIRRHARPPLFPYTTLFRSQQKDAPQNGDKLQANRDSEQAHAADAQDQRQPLARPSITPSPIADTGNANAAPERSEEHTSELQSHSDLVCRLLLEKKKKKKK